MTKADLGVYAGIGFQKGWRMVQGTFGIILLVFGAVFLLTSVISFCPLYSILGLNSGKKK